MHMFSETNVAKNRYERKMHSSIQYETTLLFVID